MKLCDVFCCDNVIVCSEKIQRGRISQSRTGIDKPTLKTQKFFPGSADLVIQDLTSVMSIDCSTMTILSASVDIRHGVSQNYIIHHNEVLRSGWGPFIVLAHFHHRHRQCEKM